MITLLAELPPVMWEHVENTSSQVTRRVVKVKFSTPEMLVILLVAGRPTVFHIGGAPPPLKQTSTNIRRHYYTIMKPNIWLIKLQRK